MPDSQFSVGRVYNLPQSVFTAPAGKVFRGWSGGGTSGTGQKEFFESGVLVFDLAKPDRTVTMTAVW